MNGLLKEERYTSIRQNCLDVDVNKADYQRALAYTANPLAQLGIGSPGDIVLQAYKLGNEDCMAFAINVAKALESSGLKVPARRAMELPTDYIQRLSDAN